MNIKRENLFDVDIAMEVAGGEGGNSQNSSLRHQRKGSRCVYGE
jgi:hypothetical protein